MHYHAHSHACMSFFCSFWALAVDITHKNRLKFSKILLAKTRKNTFNLFEKFILLVLSRYKRVDGKSTTPEHRSVSASQVNLKRRWSKNGFLWSFWAMKFLEYYRWMDNRYNQISALKYLTLFFNLNYAMLKLHQNIVNKMLIKRSVDRVMHELRNIKHSHSATRSSTRSSRV